MIIFRDCLRSLTALALLLGALASFLLVSAPGRAVGQTPQSKLPAQNPPSPKPAASPAEEIEEDEVVRVTSNLVVVPVSVTDARGQPVERLTAADFRLEEEGRAQVIAQVGAADQVPLELALLLDVSGSVNARFAFEQEAAARFLKEVLIKPADRATVYAIDITPRLSQGRASVSLATQKLMAIAPAKGPTAFYDTVVEATRYLSSFTPPGHRRVIVAISDGEDNYSERYKTALKALPEIQRADTVFYSINPSGQALRLNKISSRAQAGMQQLAIATGGSAFVPEELKDLDAVFRQIATELRSQYLLQYYSNSGAPRGKFLNIKVRVPAHAGARIRARQGYYVAGQK